MFPRSHAMQVLDALLHGTWHLAPSRFRVRAPPPLPMLDVDSGLCPRWYSVVLRSIVIIIVIFTLLFRPAVSGLCSKASDSSALVRCLVGPAWLEPWHARATTIDCAFLHLHVSAHCEELKMLVPPHPSETGTFQRGRNRVVGRSAFPNLP